MRIRAIFHFLLTVSSAVCTAESQSYDLVVYGSTSAGIIASVAAAREGLNVALIEPSKHFGGMMTGGLGRTDFGNKDVVGGYSLEFFKRTGAYYGKQPIEWYFEPHVADKIFREMLAETSVTLFMEHRLREKTGVKKVDGRVTEIELENGKTFKGTLFADCTYEGDLMAQAGVSYTVGRESSAQYNESLAGVREKTPKHQFTVQVKARDLNGKLLPEISSDPKGNPGDGDKRVQAYNFRICMTNDPNNKVPWPKPEGYDPTQFELLARMIQEWEKINGKPPSMSNLMHPAIVQGRKTDTNNNGAFSTDYIGKNYDYPDGDYATRDRIWKDHERYTKGFLYFLANDPKVPPQLRDEMTSWGLAKDEFVTNGNWPTQLYVREARRMIGEYVMSQKDIQGERAKPDVIGMGSYNSDSHNVQRIENAEGFAENEGDMQVAVKPYQIPYRSIVPKRTEATNLLVPVCYSSSHVAYSTLRMEPVFMITGQAAGVAAEMAVRGKLAVQDIDTTALTAKLREQGAVLEYGDLAPEAN